MEHGLELLATAQSAVYHSHFLALLAEVYSKLGRNAEALTTVEEALAFIERSGERYYVAEAWRLRGRLLLNAEVRMMNDERQTQKTKSIPDEAEACFERAIGIAQEQEAKWWELRASVSLAQLWQEQGKAAEAVALLASIYDCFTDGFETKDLEEARALLEALRDGSPPV